MNVAVILLAGDGQRFGKELPKQYLDIDDKPIAYYSIKAFEINDNIDLIVLVGQRGSVNRLSEMVQKYHFSKARYIIEGGATRRESSFNALKFLKCNIKDDDNILIHDGARPFVDQGIINGHILALRNAKATTTAILSDDLVAYSEDDMTVSSITPYPKAYLVQTPQGFKFKTIYDAHIAQRKSDYVRDDAGLVLANGEKVMMVLGNKKNKKITTGDDLVMLKPFVN